MTPKIRPLSDELELIAKNELNEDKNRIANDLKYLKDWLVKQPHIKARKDDQFLIAFLRGSKNSLERAKEKIDAYYTYRTSSPEFYAFRDPFDKKILEILEQGVSIPFPDLLPDGSRLLLSRICLFDLKKYNIHDIVKVAFMVADEVLLEDDNFVVCGTVIIIDVKDVSVSHGAYYTPTFLKKMATFVQYAYPFRLKAVHFINVPSTFDFFFKLLCGFLSEKIRNRFYLHENNKSLKKQISEEYLPIEYGGTKLSVKNYVCKIKDEILSKREWFLNDSHYKVDESKRIEESKNPNLYFGMEGSFRKLEVD